MGCWSESCAISGLEIGDQREALVMMLKAKEDTSYSHGSFSRYQPVCPPTWGKYSDYGDIEDIGTCDPLFFTTWLEEARRSVDPDEDNHMNFMAMFWWVRKDVWDFCDNLPHEFSYSDHPKTIGESCQRRREKLQHYVVEQRKYIEELAAVEGDNDASISLMIKSLSRRDDEIFGLREYNFSIIRVIKDRLEAAIKDNNQAEIDNCIEAVVRLNKIEMIGYELRKVICPSTMNGPQHGGYDAISMLSTFNLTKCQEVYAEYQEDED